MQMRKSWMPVATFTLSYVVQLSLRSTPAYTRMAMAMDCAGRGEVRGVVRGGVGQRGLAGVSGAGMVG